MMTPRSCVLDPVTAAFSITDLKSRPKRSGRSLQRFLMRMETLLLDDDPEASARLKLAELSFDGL